MRELCSSRVDSGVRHPARTPRVACKGGATVQLQWVAKRLANEQCGHVEQVFVWLTKLGTRRVDSSACYNSQQYEQPRYKRQTDATLEEGEQNYCHET